jgi:hypothetical protein
MTDRNDAPVDGLDDYLERFMSYPRAARTDLDAVTRRSPRPRYAAAVGAVLLAGGLAAILALAVAHHQSNGGGASQHFKGRQVDIVLRTVTGSGTNTTKPANLPHARYTFFTAEDPFSCITGVQLQDTAGKYVVGDRVPRPPNPNVDPEPFNVSLLQTDVPEGEYRVRVLTGAQPCTWRLQEILNSMSDDVAPPQAEKAPQPPRFDATISSANPAKAINVPVTGLYMVGLNFTPGKGTTSSCPVSHGFLVNSAGESVAVLGGQHPTDSIDSNTRAGFGAPILLAAGERTVRVDTACSWQLEVKPFLGPNGGGVQGFYAPPSPSPRETSGPTLSAASQPAPYTAVEVATMLLLSGGAPGACQGEAMVGTKNSVRGGGGAVSRTSPYATWTEQSPINCTPPMMPPDSAPAGTYVIHFDDCREPKAQTITLTVDAAHRVTVVKVVDSPYGQALAHHSSCREN